MTKEIEPIPCPALAAKRAHRPRVPGGVRARLLPGLAAMLGAMLLGPAAASAQDADACVGRPSDTRIYIDVENVRSNAGKMSVTLYPDVPGRFLKRKGSLYVRFVPAKAPVTRICLLIPEPGIYGLTVYHDANGNEKIDRTGIGLPAEGFGFSNNASTFLGIPSFRSVRIRLTPNMETRIRLRYLRGDEVPAGRIPKEYR